MFSLRSRTQKRIKALEDNQTLFAHEFAKFLNLTQEQATAEVKSFENQLIKAFAEAEKSLLLQAKAKRN